MAPGQRSGAWVVCGVPGKREKCVWMASHLPSRRAKITVARPGRGNALPSGWKPVEFHGTMPQARSPEAPQWS